MKKQLLTCVMGVSIAVNLSGCDSSASGDEQADSFSPRYDSQQVNTSLASLGTLENAIVAMDQVQWTYDELNNPFVVVLVNKARTEAMASGIQDREESGWQVLPCPVGGEMHRRVDTLFGENEGDFQLHMDDRFFDCAVWDQNEVLHRMNGLMSTNVIQDVNRCERRLDRHFDLHGTSAYSGEEFPLYYRGDLNNLQRSECSDQTEEAPFDMITVTTPGLEIQYLESYLIAENFRYEQQVPWGTLEDLYSQSSAAGRIVASAVGGYFTLETLRDYVWFDYDYCPLAGVVKMNGESEVISYEGEDAGPDASLRVTIDGVAVLSENNCEMHDNEIK
ncbi:MAG: hypothetical protein ACLFQH_08390 [Halothiobacillaceae bacterium]